MTAAMATGVAGALSRVRRSSAGTVAASVWVLFVVGAAVLGPLLLPYDAESTYLSQRLLPPGSVMPELGGVAWLGTDQLGRDLLPQIVRGASVSVLIGVATVIIAGVIGTVLGLVSGYRGGATDTIIQRLIDIQLAFPPTLLAIVIAAVLGPTLTNLVISLALTRWVKFARVVRGSVLKAREEPFVDGARLLGVRTPVLIVRHVLPFVLTPLVIIATVEFGLVILAEAGLSFLGLGTPPATPSWGLTISNGRAYLDSAWWISAMPGLALTFTVVAVSFLGDRVRDRLSSTKFGANEGAGKE